ncbi:MAG: adenosylcobalamin-dependent ribonucleoside-diphosphate reductase [Phycisphaerales bacterium]
MKITRKFTKDGQCPFDTTRWTKRASRITNPDGSVVFQMDDAEVPESWSQLATDIMVSKYFRKAGVPQLDDNGDAILDDSGEPVTGPERSAKQVIQRLAGCWRHWGETHGYFDSAADAQAFHDELCYMLTHQFAAPNSPQWFNTGLNWAYGITGPAQGHWVTDHKSGKTHLADDAYTHPQPHACFIQSVDDDLVNPGGIMDLWTREARLFKYGSGTGTNFSGLRAEGELLAGGGKSSGLMSWLKIGDRAAGAIKSGGTTRRAAKMVCLDLDHPDIENFVSWKVREEIKVAALVEGMKHIADEHKDVAKQLGLTLDYDFNGESYQTVSGQNANNSVRIPDDFFHALDDDADWNLTFRTTGEIARTMPARDLWDKIGFAAWRCADPGVQYDSTINAWHTCPESGRINASNPCSEYMFLDNTACNLASLNLIKFYDAENRTFDVERFEHAIDIWTIVLEISVLMAAFPSEEIARLSYEYRTLGLGYANIGAMLMQAGVPYDSDEARAVCGCITSILTGRSYRMSARLAEQHGPFPGYKRNRKSMLRVIRNHRRAAHGVARDAGEWEALTIRPVPIDHELLSDSCVNIANVDRLLAHATLAWDDALELGEKHGYRNAQVTVIAPTGTIGLLMDCDTTGVEPDFALVKFKKLAGGGYFKIANNSLRPALRALGYEEPQIVGILHYILGELTLDVPMPRPDGACNLEMTFADWLRSKGFKDDELDVVRKSLPTVFDLKGAFGLWSFTDETLERLGVEPAARADMSYDMLRRLGLTRAQTDVLNERVCGTQTIEGAPHIKDEHLPIFDCANTCGAKGRRYIRPEGHIRMMAAAQPFISGAISKTINLPHDATIDQIKDAYRLSWELGLKANALYRDGCKLSQPLSTSSSDARDEDVLDAIEDEDDIEAAREEVAAEVGAVAGAAASEQMETAVRTVERIIRRPMRRRLPDTRHSRTHKFNVAGHEGYLTVGLYEDGTPGELFITMAKEGSTIGGLMDSLGTATSVALQYGVPIQSLVNKFTHQRFEPAGMTTNRDIPIAKSLVDYIFRWMGIEFIEGYREANAPRRPGDEPVADSAPTERPRRAAESADDDSNAKRDGEDFRLDLSANGADARIEAAAPTGDGGQKTASVLSAAMLDCQGDAPACEVCGTITVRNGTCYRCLNCGHSMGCS